MVMDGSICFNSPMNAVVAFLNGNNRNLLDISISRRSKILSPRNDWILFFSVFHHQLRRPLYRAPQNLQISDKSTFLIIVRHSWPNDIVVFADRLFHYTVQYLVCYSILQNLE